MLACLHVIYCTKDPAEGEILIMQEEKAMTARVNRNQSTNVRVALGQIRDISGGTTEYVTEVDSVLDLMVEVQL